MEDELDCPFCRRWTDVGPEYDEQGRCAWECGCCGHGPRRYTPADDYKAALKNWNDWARKVARELEKAR